MLNTGQIVKDSRFNRKRLREIAVIILICTNSLFGDVYGQITGKRLTAGNTTSIDSFLISKDTLPQADSFDVLISPDAPDADVKYDSKDSAYLDAQEKMFYLFGDAVVTYQSYELKAARIRLDMNNDIAYAEGVLD